MEAYFPSAKRENFLGSLDFAQARALLDGGGLPAFSAFRAADLNNSLWYSNGTDLITDTAKIVSVSTAVGIAPNGTIAANGALTLGTALDRTYSDGVWLRFPAGAVSGGLAGMYYCVMSTTTAGTVYTNFSDASSDFVPFKPTGTLTAAVGSGSAYTQTTGAQITLLKKTIPGKTLWPNAQCIINWEFSWNNAATNRQFLQYIGDSQMVGSTRNTSGTHDSFSVRYRMMGSRQAISPFALSESSNASTTSNNLITSKNMGLDQDWTVRGQVDLATAWLIFQTIEFIVR